LAQGSRGTIIRENLSRWRKRAQLSPEVKEFELRGDMLIQIAEPTVLQPFSAVDFDAKITQAKDLIKLALNTHRTPVVACSFGKHSMVALHLVRGFAPNVKVVWNNTGVEYPETYKFVARIKREWSLDIVEARPTTTFWKVVAENGFPIHPRNAAWGLQRASTECCRQLKKKPTTKALKVLGCDLYFTGLTQFESSLRRMSARKYGKYFYSVKWKHWKCHPVLDWHTEEIWEYHNRFGIPYNPLYDMDEVPMKGGIRTGCWTCPMAIKYGKLSHLRHYYPKLFNFLVVEKGLGEAMIGLRLKAFKNVKSRAKDRLLNMVVKKAGDFKGILKRQPCFFDKL
jgi:3'-phosphoadenosine 5'-phosphosulfate sulfotransferase (PAPS reductase)/FAD synthetase